MTVAAMASSSYIMPAMGCAELSRAVRMTAAIALTKPGHRVDHRLVEPHRDTRQPRRFLVAADGVDVAAEGRTREHDVRDDVDGGRQPRPVPE